MICLITTTKVKAQKISDICHEGYLTYHYLKVDGRHFLRSIETSGTHRILPTEWALDNFIHVRVFVQS